MGTTIRDLKGPAEGSMPPCPSQGDTPYLLQGEQESQQGAEEEEEEEEARPP